MRLSSDEKSAIIQAVERLDPGAEIYLFGSRVDDTKKGGDIDILIFSDRLTFEDKLEIKAYLFERIEEQKIDLIISVDESDPFIRMALKQGVRLK